MPLGTERLHEERHLPEAEARAPRTPAARGCRGSRPRRRASHSRSGNSFGERPLAPVCPAGRARGELAHRLHHELLLGGQFRTTSSPPHMRKDAVPGRRDGLTVDHGQHQPEHVPGVARVDDAVVPRAGRWRSARFDSSSYFREDWVRSSRSPPRVRAPSPVPGAAPALTASNVAAACSPPITEMRALGQTNRKRGA